MARRGHSPLQDTELFTLLEAQVSIVRGLVAVQSDNQVVWKDRGRQGEPTWIRLRTQNSGITGQRRRPGKRGKTGQSEWEMEANSPGSRPLNFQALLIVRSPCNGEAGGLEPS